MSTSSHLDRYLQTPVRTLPVLRPGRLRYAEGLALQRALAARLAERPDEPGTLVLLEHEPVVTLGRNARPENLLVPRPVLAARGIEVHATDRGGDATYHGPGQVVGYPVVRLRALRRSVKSYVAGLEDTMIRLAAAYGVTAHRRDRLTGVWVGEKKIGSIGVHVSRGIAWHGFAFNVATDLDAFRAINPCGLAGCVLTSLAALLGRAPGFEEALDRAAAAFGAAFGVALRPAAAGDLPEPAAVPAAEEGR